MDCAKHFIMGHKTKNALKAFKSEIDMDSLGEGYRIYKVIVSFPLSDGSIDVGYWLVASKTEEDAQSTAARNACFVNAKIIEECS